MAEPSAMRVICQPGMPPPTMVWIWAGAWAGAVWLPGAASAWRTLPVTLLRRPAERR
jgi:hypothetical protein